MDRHDVSLFAGILGVTAFVGYLGLIGYTTGKSVVDNFSKWKETYPKTATKLTAFLYEPTKGGFLELLDPDSETV